MAQRRQPKGRARANYEASLKLPAPTQVVAKRDDDFGSLAAKLKVDEQEFVQANPKETKISAGAVYNVPPQRALQGGGSGSVVTGTPQLGVPDVRQLQQADVEAGLRFGDDPYTKREARQGTGTLGITDIRDTPGYYGFYETEQGLAAQADGDFSQLYNPMYNPRPNFGAVLEEGEFRAGEGPPPYVPPVPSALDSYRYQPPPDPLTAKETMISEIIKWPSFPGEDIAEIKLDRPEYWDRIGRSQAVKSRIDSYLRQFLTPDGLIDWDAAVKQDPDLGETLMKLGYHLPAGIELPDYTDQYGNYNYPASSYYSGSGSGGSSGGGGYSSSGRNPSLGLVSWNI